MREYHISRLLSLPLLLLTLLLSVRPVAAHGDGAILRLSEAPAGPFTLNVWTYPGFLIPGTVHFSVAVQEAASGNPMPATAVFIQVAPLDEQNPAVPLSSRATLEYQTLLHEGYLDIQEPGRYRVTVQVAASVEEQGQVSFEIDVFSGTVYKLMVILFMGVTGTFAIWFAREGLRTWGIERWVSNLRGARHLKNQSLSQPPWYKVPGTFMGLAHTPGRGEFQSSPSPGQSGAVGRAGCS